MCNEAFLCFFVHKYNNIVKCISYGLWQNITKQTQKT